MIYILIALALFGALTIVLARQGDQSDNQSMTEDMAQFETTQVLSFAQSAQSVVNQMLMSGTNVDTLDFARPNASSYDTAPYYHKVYHPEGGGLINKEATSKIFIGVDNDPDPGWYMGRFNNVEWTPTTANDIILTAHQISDVVCRNINEKVTGATTIPAIAGTGNLADYLIDEEEHSGSNADFDVAVCPDCEGFAMMCVSNTAADMWDFYVIIEGM